jgi:hypothetical protein
LGGKHNAIMEPSTTHLPYFDGDYWPGDAENQLAEMEKGVASGQSASRMCCLFSVAFQRAVIGFPE